MRSGAIRAGHPGTRAGARRFYKEKTMKSLRRKLAFSYGLLIVFTLAVSAWGIYHLVHLGRAVDVILVNNYKSILAAENMKEALERIDSSAMFFVASHADKARQQFTEN